MEQLRRKVRAVRRRLHWLRFASVTLVSLFWLSVAAALALVVCRLIVPIEDAAHWQVTTWYIVGGLLTLSIPLGLASLLFGRLSLFRAALVADEHLRLCERLSSALLLKGPRRPMEELLEADALAAAEKIRPRRDFPFQPPRVLRLLPLPLIVLVLTALLLEQRNLLASQQREITPEERRMLEMVALENREEAQALRALATQIQEAGASLASSEALARLRQELERIAEQLEEPDASRLEQLAELSDLADQVAQRRQELEAEFESNRNFAADPSAQVTRGLQQAMQRGDLQGAQRQVEQLLEQMESGALSEQQMEQLAQEMQQMAQQMGADSQTGQALQQAAQAIRAMAQSNAQGQQGVGEAMAALREAMSELQDAQEQLALAEALEADLNARRASMARDPRDPDNRGRCRSCGARLGENGQCGNCNGQGRLAALLAGSGSWRPGETLGRRGMGTGGPGQGRGGRPPESDNANVTFRDEQLTTVHLPGQIIAEFRHHDGVQVAGESTVPLSDVFLAYDQEAERTLETEVIPAGYRSIARGYFDAIRPAGTPAAEGGDGRAETGQAATP